MIFISAGQQDMIKILLVKFKINEPKTPVVSLLGRRMPSIKESGRIVGKPLLFLAFL